MKCNPYHYHEHWLGDKWRLQRRFEKHKIALGKAILCNLFAGRWIWQACWEICSQLGRNEPAILSTLKFSTFQFSLTRYHQEFKMVMGGMPPAAVWLIPTLQDPWWQLFGHQSEYSNYMPETWTRQAESIAVNFSTYVPDSSLWHKKQVNFTLLTQN